MSDTWSEFSRLHINRPMPTLNVYSAVKVDAHSEGLPEKNASRQFSGGSHNLDVIAVLSDMFGRLVVREPLRGYIENVRPVMFKVHSTLPKTTTLEISA